MNRLSHDKRTQVVECLTEGCSIRSTVRLTGAAKNTVTKLAVEIGKACDQYQRETLRDLPCTRMQVDEIWSFVYAKAKNVPEDKRFDMSVGDVWTWTAICADTKLIPTWYVGSRDASSAYVFIQDLAERMASRIQLTSNGHQPYLRAVDRVFGDEIDYAMLVKLYGSDGNPNRPEARYSPGKCNGARSRRISGSPDAAHISTSYAERANLSMRMGMRRFTRLTNAFSKKLENHCAAIALYFMHYNFARVHMTTKQTPAQAAGVTDKKWSIGDIVRLLD
jgi:IS1 family transposase